MSTAARSFAAAVASAAAGVFERLDAPLGERQETGLAADALSAAIPLGPGQPRLVLSLDRPLATHVVGRLAGAMPQPVDPAMLQEAVMEAANLVAGRLVAGLAVRAGGAAEGFSLGLPVPYVPRGTIVLRSVFVSDKGRVGVALEARGT